MEGPAEASKSAMRKMLAALRDDGLGFGILMFVGRTGYDDESPLVPIIPLAKSVGSVLCRTPEVAEDFGIDLESMPAEGRTRLFGE